MASRKTKTTRRRTSRRKKKPLISVKRILSFVLLSLMLGISICAVGYVIFFRTVFAQEIPKQQEVKQQKAEIVFEEPDPPVHDEPTGEQREIEKRATEKELPKVAIIIDDLGYHKKLGEKFLNFPYELTYSFLPFAPYTAKQEEMAYNSGKTVLLHLPLEPKGKQWDPGPGTLFLSDSPELQKEKFEKALAQVPRAMGVNNHMGSLYTGSDEAMGFLIKQIGEEGLFFVDSVTVVDSVGYIVALEHGVKSVQRHVFLDNVLDVQKICVQIDKLVKIAKKKGWGVGIGHPHEQTWIALNDCLPQYINYVSFVYVNEMF